MIYIDTFLKINVKSVFVSKYVFEIRLLWVLSLINLGTFFTVQRQLFSDENNNFRTLPINHGQ